MINGNYIFTGDNLQVLQSDSFKDAVSKVDTIYIDPPYNTKNCFTYNDKKKREEWLAFMRARLVVAKTLLKSSGVIFISIDDNEYSYLKNLADEIFEEKNLLGTFITMQSQRSNAKHINIVHEYVLVYAKDKSKVPPFKIKRILDPCQKIMIDDICYKVKTEFAKNGADAAKNKLNTLIKKYCAERNITWLKNYSNIDEYGCVYFAKDLSTPGKPRKVDIDEIGLHLEPLETRGWSSDKKFKALHEAGMLCFKSGRPYEKHLLVDSEDNAPSVLNFYSRQGTNDLKALGLRDLFDTPKPVELIKYLIRLSTPKNGVVLDFFAGSGTTGQAIYELNKEDQSNRRFVLVQLDERMGENTKAYKVCMKLGIEPIISEALIYRLKTFLKKNWLDDPTLKIENLK